MRGNVKLVLFATIGLILGGLSLGVGALPTHTAHAQSAESSESTGGEAPAIEVAVRDDRFTDARLTIAPGTTVTWTHKGNNLHTISATDGAWDSGTLQRGDTFSFTFTEPGVYSYLCRQHLLQGMRGTITVEAP